MSICRNALIISLIPLMCSLDAIAQTDGLDQDAEMANEAKPFTVAPGDGDHVWFLGQLGTIKLSVEETAEFLSISVSTAVRRWRAARAWIKAELDG